MKNEFITNEELLHRRYVEEKLKESEKRAAAPDAVWYFHEEFWKKAREIS